MKGLEKILERVDDFPTLPTIYTTLSDIMANPRSTAADVAEVITQDQSSTSKVLRVANSSMYGFRGRINTVTQAIVYIGFDEVKNLVIALSIIDLFKKGDKSSLVNPVELWKHSLGVGVITRHIGKTLGIKNLENYFISGILHDIGKLLFYKYFQSDYEKAVAIAMEKGISAKDAETAVLGISHTVAGNLLAEKWEMPISIKNAISYHYSGRVSGKIDSLVGAVHIADIAASLLRFGQAGHDIVPEPNPQVWEAFDLPENYFTSSLQSFINDYEECLATLLKN